MFPFAHIGYTFFVVELISIFIYILRKLKNKNIDTIHWGIKYISLYALLIGSVGPDIIDKAISLPITGHGRYIGHSLLFNLLISLIVLAVFWKNRRIWIGFIVGWQMHILLDLGGFIPWFFPFVGYDFPERTLSFWEMLQLPSVYLNEIFGAVGLIFVIVLYIIRRIPLLDLLKEDFSKQPSYLITIDKNRKNI
ncbi:MAG: metal-dependent hydrolase [Candidatus Heimdallarchaeaceae archaeon]